MGFGADGTVGAAVGAGAAGTGAGAAGTGGAGVGAGATLGAAAGILAGAGGATGGAGATGFAGAGAGAGAGAEPPPKDSRRRRATGASTVDDADFTNSPCSLKRARTSLLVTPSSLANSCTRALPATTSPVWTGAAVLGRALG